MRALGSWLAQHRLVLATGFAAALPVLVSGVRALGNDWVPLGDDAVIAVRAYDVFTLHSPLLGQSSAASGVAGGDPHSLGPLLYWLLALPSRFGGAEALVVAMTLLNAAAVIATVALARRRGGLPLMLAVGVGLALVCASLSPETLHSVWNPSAAQLPFALLILLCWSLAAGEHRLLPVTVLVASFVIQCHLTYVLPAAGMLAIGLLTRPRPPRAYAIPALAVGAVCWSFPVLDQLIHRPGNFVAVVSAAVSGAPTLGFDAGWHAIVRAVGVPPWWLREPQDPFTRLSDVTTSPPLLSSLSALLVLTALVAITVLGRRRRRLDLAAAGAIGLVLCASIGLVARSTPDEAGGLSFTIAYTLRWASPAGMWVWIVLGWAATVVLVSPSRLAKVRFPAIARTAGVVAVAAVGTAVAAGTGPDLLESRYRPAREVADRIRAELRPGEEVLVGGSLDAFDYQATLIYELRRDGTIASAPDMAQLLGDSYRVGDRQPSRLVTLAVVARGKRRPQGRVVARVRDPVRSEATGQPQTLIATLAPAPGNR